MDGKASILCDQCRTNQPDKGILSGGRIVAWCFGCRIRGGFVGGCVVDLIPCPSEGVSRIDAGRCSVDCECSICGRRYARHPDHADYPFMTLLCDGTLVKL